MKLSYPIVAAALMLSVHSLSAQGGPSPAEAEDLFRKVRKHPAKAIIRNGEHVSAVDVYYEKCEKKAQARYTRVLTHTPQGLYDARVMTPHGALLMRGTYADAHGSIEHGDFIYYDEAGTVRASGAYVHGVKAGLWMRFDERGGELPEKFYDGLAWEAKEISLGLASRTATPHQDIAGK